MNRMFSINKQKGYSSILLLVLLLPLLAFFTWKNPAPEQAEDQEPACRPNYATSDGKIKGGSQSPLVTAPSYKHDHGASFPELIHEMHPYRLIKPAVGMPTWALSNYYNKDELRSSGDDYQLHNPVINRGSDGTAHYHFSQWVHPVVELSGKKYAILYPASYSGSPGYSAPYLSESGPAPQLFFADYQIIFLVHLNDDGSMVTFDGKDQNDASTTFGFADVYQQVRDDNHDLVVRTLPQEVFKCKENDESLGEGSFVVTTTPGAGSSNSTLQLGTFIPKGIPVEFDWYFPYCKPAIYLYPEKKEQVSVQVNPKGYLTYTDPLYPDGGWMVTANPNGQIETNGKTYDYLYYESKIRESAMTKPTKGYVVTYDELPALYTDLLPKLGLTQKQTKDFKEYWEKTLPKSPYYFVGVMPEKDVDYIEPLTISPKPDTIIRVRLYFEALDQKKTVEQPTLGFPAKKGFTVVEWGATAKLHSGSEFICSQ